MGAAVSSEESRAVALSRVLPSVSIDPLTRTEIGARTLPVGTVIHAADAVLRDAEARGLQTVVVRLRVPGATGLAMERVDVALLRAALQEP